ncbi:PIN domain-like protein [Favolaschia claudopus]|uniref:PIN domain-like protein n=1 Tax=Favolaschia claudopus TaxID=2862362 RepID=A0AAW0C4B7_9AGAR
MSGVWDADSMSQPSHRSLDLPSPLLPAFTACLGCCPLMGRIIYQTIPNFRLRPPNSIVLSGGDSAQEPELEAQLAAMEFDTPAAWCDAEDVMDTVRVCDNEDIACMATPSLFLPTPLPSSLTTTMGIIGFWPLIETQRIKAAEETHNYLQFTVEECFRNGVQERPPLVMGIASIWDFQATATSKFGTTQAGPNPALRTLYYKLAALLDWPILPLFIVDGPERPDIKRGRRVLMRGHPLTTAFQELAGYFGYPCYMAPGEADAELGRLAAEGIIDFVQTTDSDVFLFGAEHVIYTRRLPPGY